MFQNKKKSRNKLGPDFGGMPKTAKNIFTDILCLFGVLFVQKCKFLNIIKYNQICKMS